MTNMCDQEMKINQTSQWGSNMSFVFRKRLFKDFVLHLERHRQTEYVYNAKMNSIRIKHCNIRKL